MNYVFENGEFDLHFMSYATCKGTYTLMKKIDARICVKMTEPTTEA